MTPRVVAALLTVAAAGMLAAAMSSAHSRSAPSAPARPLAIMPLGDSITVGWPDIRYGGYRHRLGALLTSEGYRVRFIGSQQSGAGLIAGPSNEGHLGWTIAALHAGIDRHGLLDTYRPDIVLLHIGTNDLHHGRAAAAPAALAALLHDLTARLPDARVVVAQIIPFASGPNDAYRAYVSAIPAIAAREGPGISVVDMRSILMKQDYFDELHPNDRGYDKMASAWNAAIRAAVAATAR